MNSSENKASAMDGFTAVSQNGFDRCESLRVRPALGPRAGVLPAMMVLDLVLVLVLGLLLTVTGCEVNSSSTTRADKSKSPPDQTSEGAVSIEGTTVGSNRTNGAADNRRQVDDSASGIKPASDEKTAEAISDDVDAAHPSDEANQSAATSAKPRKVDVPSPEQLARWTRPSFEPLQLLACRDWDRLGIVTCMDKTPDGRFFILGGAKVTVWTVGSKDPEHTLLDPADIESTRLFASLAVSPDGKWVGAGDTAGRLTIWNLADQTVIASKGIYNNDITQIAISPDSRQIATISFDNVVSIWSADSLEPKTRFEVTDHGVKRVAFITSNLLAVAGEKVTTWDTLTGTLVQELSPGRYNYMLARSPDNKWFAFGVEEGLSFWNVDESKVAMQAHVDLASGSLLEYSPDAKYLATASDSMIRIWDLTSQQVVQAIDALGPAISGLRWMPNSNILVVASESGRTRIWGTPAAGQPHGLQPLPAAVTLPATKSQEPATPAQLLTAIDLRSFPRLPSGAANLNDSTMLRYQASVDQKEAELFYRHFLGHDGWVELPPTQTTSPGTIEFGKNGFLILARFSREDSSKTSIDLTHMGNFDQRWVPRIEAGRVEDTFEGSSGVLYKVKLDLVQIEATLLRKLHEAGWIAYSRLHSSHSEETDSRDMEFLRNSTILRVVVQRPYDDPSVYHVQYSGLLTLHSLPIPPDSGFVEFDGSSSPHLVSTTSMNLDETRNYYDTEMNAQGWIQMERGRTIKDDYNWLTYMRGQQDLVIGLERGPDGRTLVRVGDRLENSSWQLAKPDPVADADTPRVGIEAADIPILNSSGTANYDSNLVRIEFQIDATPLSVVAETYTGELAKFGFTPKESGIRDDDYTFLTFVKEDVEIDLRAHNRNGNAQVSLMGDGLLWNKPLSVPKQVVSYEAWLRQHRHPAGLGLLDQYVAEMRLLTQDSPSNGK
jgi:WD40 repeat protein